MSFFCGHEWIEQERVLKKGKTVTELLGLRGINKLELSHDMTQELKDKLYIVSKCTKCGKLDKLEVY